MVVGLICRISPRGEGGRANKGHNGNEGNKEAIVGAARTRGGLLAGAVESHR